jgi:hypothetical protein
VVTAQVSATVPVNELDGVTVMVEVLPVVAPGASEMLPLLESVKLLLPLGASQNPEHPASSGAAASNRRAHFPIFIAAPLLLPASSSFFIIDETLAFDAD